MAYYLAKAMGLKGVALEDVHMAAHLHDIGKLSIPENILNKKEKLLPCEWDQIPLGSRIIAVADSIDAMTSRRPYRSAMTWEQCREEVRTNKGLQFDPIAAERSDEIWNKLREQSGNL